MSWYEELLENENCLVVCWLLYFYLFTHQIKGSKLTIQPTGNGGGGGGEASFRSGQISSDFRFPQNQGFRTGAVTLASGFGSDLNFSFIIRKFKCKNSSFIKNIFKLTTENKKYKIPVYKNVSKVFSDISWRVQFLFFYYGAGAAPKEDDSENPTFRMRRDIFWIIQLQRCSLWVPLSALIVSDI